MATDRNSLKLIKGTVDILILKTLTQGPQHGYGVSAWIRERTGGELGIEDAALYQALHRLESRDLVVSEWGLDPSLLGHDENRSREIYRRVMERLRSLPEIENAALSSIVPFGSVTSMRGVQLAGPADPETAIPAHYYEILWQMVREGSALTAAGPALGLLLAIGFAQLLSSMLYQVSARDPLVFLGSTILLAPAATLAAYLPARRATRVEPTVALRHE